MRRGLAGVAAAVAVIPWVFSAGSAGAEACSQYTALAGADGARVMASTPSAGLVQEADAAAPAAQAYVDSSGRSEAFAGLPYPGATALSALALAGTHVSQVPLLAQSSFPVEPEADASAPGGTLRAESGERASQAHAEGGAATGDGPAVGATRALAAASCDGDGKVAATATSAAEGLSFGAGILRIGGIDSVAEAVVGPGGKPVLRSRLSVSGATVLGQAVAITERGLEAGGSAAALPANPLAAALKGAGITITYLTATQYADGAGVVAPGLLVSAKGTTSTGAQGEVAFTFGRAHARAESSGAAPVSPATTAARPAVRSEPGAPAAPEPGSDGTASGGSATVTPASAVDGTSAATPSASPVSGRAPEPELALRAPASAARLYPVLVAAGLAVVAGMAGVRRIGLTAPAARAARGKRGTP